MYNKAKLAIAGWVLIVLGGSLAHLIQTTGGIDIEDVRFEYESGRHLSALLYRPANATPASPAPGILAVHGYINSRETQSGFAIEFARRGYVVLAIDQTGHGFSEGPAFGAGFGGPAGLRYLRGLPFVDTSQIGLEGHSMGGWTSLAAAADQPDGYRSLALVGSSTGPGFVPVGTPEFPRNLGVIFSRYDEFAPLMWGVADAADVGQSEKLRAVFGTEAPVVPEQLYGSIEQGTARWLTIPDTTHPGDHLSGEAIGDTVDWMAMTLSGGTQLDSADQIWHWKEFGTLIALIGGMLVLLGSCKLILGMPAFQRLAGVPPAALPGGWWSSAALAAAIPALTYYPLTGLGALFTANALFPQGVTNQILIWALGNGLIVLGADAFVRRKARVEQARFASAALEPSANWPRAASVAVLSTLCLYLAVVLSDVLFKTDLRFWVVALKPMAAHHFPVFLAYVLPFTAYFHVSQRIWLRGLAPTGSALGQYVSTVVASIGGLFVLVAGCYFYLFASGHLPPVDPLFTIVAIQFLPVLSLTAIVSVFAWRRTGRAETGAIICGLLVSWYVVAGQATHL
ncbi:MAG: alpha/beta fold hydrolase [Pseudomonadales bacterium]|nr:alpha/beta fold hydrolase [Pseudomonadales bacterium]